VVIRKFGSKNLRRLAKLFLVPLRPWFPGYWDWLGCPGLPPVLVSISPFPLRIPYLGVFPFTLQLPLDFNRIISLRLTYLHPFDRPFTLLMVSFHACMGLALVPHVVVPEAEHWVRMKQKSRFKCLPWPGFEPRTSQPYLWQTVRSGGFVAWPGPLNRISVDVQSARIMSKAGWDFGKNECSILWPNLSSIHFRIKTRR